MDEKVKTRVIFKMTPFHESECIAFLLDCEANPGFVLSYMHVGQHSEASLGFMRHTCRQAKPEEYTSLQEELESIGYDLSRRVRWYGKRQ